MRRVGAAVALPCLAILMAAALLTPDPSGRGTHEQLGLMQCSFLARHGFPCPTCGLTTSVSATLHGRLGLAVRSRPFGIVATLALVVLAAAGTAQAVTGRRWLARLRPGLGWVWVGAGGLLADWGGVLAAGFARGTFPVH